MGGKRYQKKEPKSTTPAFFSGVCFLGIWDTTVLRGFVLAPLLAAFCIGLGFLLAGFVYMHKIRTVLAANGKSHTEKLDKMRTRIIIFAVTYAAPTASIIGCLLYEQNYLDEWMITWHNRVCRDPDYSLKCPSEAPENRDRVTWPAPIFWVFVLKYIAILSVPLASVAWIASKKTLKSWARFYRKCCGFRYDEAPQSARDYAYPSRL